jgi:type VI secretion system secreted protein Hcp
MALDLFLKLDGIKGESKDTKHRDEIDVLSWNWGLANESSSNPGRGEAKVTFHEMNITKRVDSATPALMLACSSGKHINEANLTVRRPGKSESEFVRIRMNDVTITSVTAGNAGEDVVTENLMFKFYKIELDYAAQNQNGTNSEIKNFKWDLSGTIPGKTAKKADK